MSRQKNKNGALPRGKVVSFRVTEAQLNQLQEMRDSETPIGIKSAKQYARKIVMDHLAGRLVYTNPEDAYTDKDAAAAVPA